jgi:predicted DCC family thiol-disulfide oxidoreductase YuxK
VPNEEAMGRRADVDVEVFYDGACPLCAREMRLIRRRDHCRRIGFVDIAADGFDPASAGVGQAALMDRIHARLPDGTLIEGVEVFRRLYTILGLGWLVAPTRLPGVSHLLDLAYRVFARNRLRLTGRCAIQAGVAPGRLARCSPARRESSCCRTA